MLGALLSILIIGAVLGTLGRMVVPGRHGIVLVVRRNPRLAPRFLIRDPEARWELGAGWLGGVMGYFLGIAYDAQVGLGASPARWYLAIIGSAVIVGISVASGVIERSKMTRRMGMHR